MSFHEFWRQAREKDPGDAALLVFADALIERGESYGEFIHLQCRRARLPADHPERATLEARERALLAADGSRWLGPAWHPLIEFEFVRGVPTGRFGHAGFFVGEREGDGLGYRPHLRIYPDGLALTVSIGEGGTRDGIPRWFNRDEPDLSRGFIETAWRDDGLGLTFEGRSDAGVVKYAGVLRDGVIDVMTESLINGNQGRVVHRLLEVPGCDTRSTQVSRTGT